MSGIMHPRYKRRRFITLLIFCDYIVSCAAYAGAIWLFTDLSQHRGGFGPPYVKSLPILLAMIVALFFVFRQQRIMWGHAAVKDLVRLSFYAAAASLCGYISLRITATVWLSPILLVSAFTFSICGMVGIRLSPRLLEELKAYSARRRGGEPDSRIPLLIIGAGNSAEALLKELERKDKVPQYKVVGLIDNDPEKAGLFLRGVPILGDDSKLSQIVKQTNARQIIIALPSLSSKHRRTLISACTKTGCRVKIMDSVAKLSSARNAKFRDLDMTDLLGRQEVALSSADMSKLVKGKTVLVTGGGGSIGSEICRQVLNFSPAKLVIYDFYENNAYNIAQELIIAQNGAFADSIFVRIGSVQDEKRLDEVFSEFSPRLVFHAAAYKHVPLMEESPQLAIENNVFGTYNTAMCAIRHNAERFILISSDKAVNPANVMGATKRIAELVVDSFADSETVFCSVRFGNVLGSNGSVVPIFKRQIELGGPVTVTSPDVVRYFMTITEAVSLVLLAGSKAKGGEVFVLDMGEPVKIDDLARMMIELAGLKPGKDIEIVYTGLRPGDKLVEELALSVENVTKTPDEKIFILSDKTAHISGEEICDAFRDAIGTKRDLRETIKRFVPSFGYETEVNDGRA